MALSLCGKRFLKARSVFRHSVRHQGYIVLIPEIGEDLPEKNPLLQQNGLPEFNNITIENCMAAIGKQTLEFENDIKEIESKLAKNEVSDVFTDVIDPLEKQGTPLDMTWGLSKTLYFGHSTKMPTKNYLAIHERAKRARAAKYYSKPIFEAVSNELVPNKNGVRRTDEQVRIIKKFSLEGSLNGLSLESSKKVQLTEVLNNLNEEKNEFKSKVEAATNRFSHTITDASIIKDMPKDIVSNLSESRQMEKGPWKVTLQPHVAIPFMEYCPDRMLRWNIWQAMVSRGSGYNRRDHETSTHLEKIRSLRNDEANILGYKTYADMSMETKMAGSVENVQNMLNTLLESAFPAQTQELESLYKFALENGFEGARIELWDLPFWRKLQRKTLYEFDENKLREYFPFDKVTNGLFEICETLFNIKIIQRSNVSTWNKNVKFYDVFEDHSSNPVAGFYLDAFTDKPVNAQNGWMVGIQNKSLVAGTMPLAALVFNFKTPVGDNPSVLSFDEVKFLFNKFGYALQHLLSRTSYSEVSGLSNVEWDAVEVSGHVLSHFLYDKTFLDKVSSHVQSEDKLPDHMFKSLIKAHEHMAGVNLCRELYLSALDLEMYSSRNFWLDIVKELWPAFRSFPLDKLDSHPCSFTQIFCEEWAAAYFCHVWSRVIAADVFSAFHEVRKDEKQMLEVGKRFRDTFLALGGACHSSQVFRKFRGRDPSPKALISSLGLKLNKSTSEKT